jgi:hypothetical protein
MDATTSPHQPRSQRGGAILFAVGILLALLLTTLIIWANFEAVFYGFTKLTTDRLDSLRCPLLMTTAETNVVSADFTNPSDKPVNMLIRADISSPALLRSEQQLLSLAPGETKTVHWSVSAADMDLGYFIFAKAYQYPSYAGSTREATCGTFVLGFPSLNGGLIFAVTLTLSLGCILGGLLLWERNALQINRREVDTGRAMKFLAIVMLLNMFFSFRGNWVAGIGLLAVSILMLGALLFFLTSQTDK